jgi:hypothetical protein
MCLINALTGQVKLYSKCPVIRLTKQVKFIREKCKSATGEEHAAHWAVLLSLLHMLPII